jgi:hypothetical protein
LLVHIGDPSSNQATTLESQVIHMIQELFGQTLSNLRDMGIVGDDLSEFIPAGDLSITWKECWARPVPRGA